MALPPASKPRLAIPDDDDYHDDDDVEAGHASVRDPAKEGGGDGVGQPEHHEHEASGGGGETICVGKERLQ